MVLDDWKARLWCLGTEKSILGGLKSKDQNEIVWNSKKSIYVYTYAHTLLCMHLKTPMNNYFKKLSLRSMSQKTNKKIGIRLLSFSRKLTI